MTTPIPAPFVPFARQSEGEGEVRRPESPEGQLGYDDSIHRHVVVDPRHLQREIEMEDLGGEGVEGEPPRAGPYHRLPDPIQAALGRSVRQTAAKILCSLNVLTLIFTGYFGGRELLNQNQAWETIGLSVGLFVAGSCVAYLINRWEPLRE